MCNPGSESAHFCLFLGRRVALGGVPEVRVLADPELLAFRVPVVAPRPLPPALLVICTQQLLCEDSRHAELRLQGVCAQGWQ